MIRRGRDAGPGSAVARQCRETLAALRAAFIEALGSAGVDPSRAREGARRLGIDKNLMWRVSKVVGEPDVLEAVRSIPRRTALGRLLNALDRAGVPAPIAARVASAHADFDRLVERHAGDRESFEFMVAGLSTARSAGARVGASLLQARKLAFRGNVGIWGVQARTQLHTMLLAPGAGGMDSAGGIDAVQLFGLSRLRRLRPGLRWTLALRRTGDDDGCSARAGGGVPLDPQAPRDGPGLIEAFSTKPFPELAVETSGDTARYVLEGGDLGRTGELTALFGMQKRGLGEAAVPPGERFAQFIAHLLTPVEHLQVDLLVHADLAWAHHPRAALLGRLDGRPWHFGCGWESEELPGAGVVADLGSGLTGAPTPRLPGYPALLDWTFEQAGWDPARFRLFRFELPYPPLPAQAILFSELPAPAAAEKGRR